MRRRAPASGPGSTKPGRPASASSSLHDGNADHDDALRSILDLRANLLRRPAKPDRLRDGATAAHDERPSMAAPASLMAEPFVPPVYPYEQLGTAMEKAAAHEGGVVDLS